MDYTHIRIPSTFKQVGDDWRGPCVRHPGQQRHIRRHTGKGDVPMSEVRPAIRRAARDSRACAHVWTEPGGGPQQARKETGRWRCVDYTDGAEFDHVRVEPGKAGAKKDVYWDPPPKASGKKPSAFLYPAMRHQGADTVIIAEGEKAADALADHLLGCKVIVLGTCSGSVAPTKAAIAAFQKHVRRPAPELRGQLKRWSEDCGAAFAAGEPNMGGMVNREADNWRQIFGVADQAGGGWSARIRQAAEKVQGRRTVEAFRGGPAKNGVRTKGWELRVRAARVAELLFMAGGSAPSAGVRPAVLPGGAIAVEQVPEERRRSRSTLRPGSWGSSGGGGGGGWPGRTCCRYHAILKTGYRAMSDQQEG